ncbi:MAG: hypothetical protein ACOWWO_12095 [Peptococcaceae bacterium]
MKGISKLAQTMKNFTAEMGKSSEVLVLGMIKEDLSLLTDDFEVTIPAGDYLVARTLTLDDPLTGTVANQGLHGHGPGGSHSQYAGDGIHTHPGTEGAHFHEIKRPEKLAPLQPGDRVLVAWVNQGLDPVVIDVVVNC